MHRSALASLRALCALAAATAATTATAHAFDSVQTFDPVPAGQGYLYYVKEHDVNGQPLPGRTVTMSVQQSPNSGATVAPCDAQGHVTGAAAQLATQVSGSDGLAYFCLHTSTTPGNNTFTWEDGTYTGEVIVVGKPVPGGPTAAPTPSPSTPAPVGAASASASPSASPVAGKPPQQQRPQRPAVAHSGLPSVKVPPLAAGLLAMLLVFLFLPPVLARASRFASIHSRS